ncbi:hypothetical protein NDU88_000723 [Pleurodeles waltl]|uniref:Uncharacterized protein n=1 Tax=Pleurodeles waltl TaxID=8319 RepID=A0AAV7KRI7_PLEWA|nr:hypothetical protein NDU88_000723 [Pleurodeles waltl]
MGIYKQPEMPQRAAHRYNVSVNYAAPRKETSQVASEFTDPQEVPSRLVSDPSYVESARSVRRKARRTDGDRVKPGTGPHSPTRCPLIGRRDYLSTRQQHGLFIDKGEAFGEVT